MASLKIPMNQSFESFMESNKDVKKDVRGAGTAISRKNLSAPVRWLKSKDLIKGRVLDYGSGRGFDADELDADRYDPYWHPTKPKGKFDTIICNYVLNVVDEAAQESILRELKSYLRKGGKAYITVRRDMKGNKASKIDWDVQRWVVLDLPTVKKTADFETYLLEK